MSASARTPSRGFGPFPAPHTILIATDFSFGSDRALRHAWQIAASARARVVLMHAFHVEDEFPTSLVTDPPTRAALARAKDADVRRLEEYAEGMSAGGLCVETRLVEHERSPSDAILETACQISADLIVLGTHGRHGLSRILVGSVAEQVVRNACMPVLVVH